MNRFIQPILKIKTLYILLSLLAFCILVDFSYMEYINTDEIKKKYDREKQVEQEAVDYNEHDDLMADFKDDLAEIDLEQVEDTKTGSAYWDDIYFNVYYVSIPLIAGCLTLCFMIFIGFHFTDQYSKIPFGNLFKSTLLAYVIFPLMDLFKCIWFGLIQTNYQMVDIQQVSKILNPSILTFIETPKEYQWYNNIFYNMDLQNLIYVLLIPLFLKVISGYKYTDFLKKMIIPFVGFVIVYLIISPNQIFFLIDLYEIFG